MSAPQFAGRPGMRLIPVLMAIGLAGETPALTPLAASYGGCADTTIERNLDVAPDDAYQSVVDGAIAGDRIRFSAGTYDDGLKLYDLNGEPGRCIVVEGPDDGSAVFIGEPLDGIRNVIQIRNSSYLAVRNFEIDGTGTTNLDGIKAESVTVGAHPNPWSHHVTLENLHIHDFDFDQQQVGISTKAPAWNWVVRNSVIERVGTGIYFGNSDGAEHFVNSLVEFNLIRDSVGYNMQIKHQFAASRPAGIGYESLPANGRTVVRHNVFHKSENSSGGPAARPNLLIGSVPLTGDGADDDTVIYCNFFFENPTGFEALFQGEGHLIVFANLFYNSFGPGLFIQPQNGEVRRVRLFQNTVLTDGDGISVSSSVNSDFPQQVVGNAVFAGATPIAGGDQADNIVDSLSNAGDYVVNPSGIVSGDSDRMDLFPLPGQLSGAAIDLSPLTGQPDSDRDFNDRPRDGTFRGAYAGEGDNPGRQLALAIKSLEDADLIFADGFE